MNLMVTDINVQNAIDNYVTGTYKEKLDLRDFIRDVYKRQVEDCGGTWAQSARLESIR